ncbi:hypothetical protein E2C01_051975 [Portunus trituberculatus]|uniref:Uncharacterized protein n=1 Tax=Portunus trituberculatus TaxID=210409 RepID=A0A5B7GKH4_PORTR|nr:hypothetical protein [Portunus trituberculatus]
MHKEDPNYSRRPLSTRIRPRKDPNAALCEYRGRVLPEQSRCYARRHLSCSAPPCIGR